MARISSRVRLRDSSNYSKLSRLSVWEFIPSLDKSLPRRDGRRIITSMQVFSVTEALRFKRLKRRKKSKTLRKKTVIRKETKLRQASRARKLFLLQSMTRLCLRQSKDLVLWLRLFFSS